MELNTTKKIIIGGFIVIVIAIFGYLYFDYKSSNNAADITSGKEGDIEIVEKEKITKEEDDIIIVHITGAVNDPRNCKNERRSKIVRSC